MVAARIVNGSLVTTSRSSWVTWKWKRRSYSSVDIAADVIGGCVLLVVMVTARHAADKTVDVSALVHGNPNVV